MTSTTSFLLGMDDSSPEVRNLLTALMDKAIPADEQGLDRAGDREISMALFGTYVKEHSIHFAEHSCNILFIL